MSESRRDDREDLTHTRQPWVRVIVSGVRPLSAVLRSRTTLCSSIPAAAHRGILCTFLIPIFTFLRIFCPRGSGVLLSRRTPNATTFRQRSPHFVDCPTPTAKLSSGLLAKLNPTALRFIT